MSSRPKVYILESKYHGSNQQLESLARECFSEFEPEALRLESRTRAKIFLPVLKLLVSIINHTGQDNSFSQFLKKWALTGYPKQGVRLRPDDVVLSKTPPFEFPSVMLRAGGQAISYHVGDLKRWPRRFFDYLISTPSTPASEADFLLETLPSSITLETYSKHRSPLGSYYLFLIGGDAKGFSYQEDDWRNIVNFINDSFERSGKKWVISTSPRTSAVVERLLEHYLDEAAVKELVLWSSGDRKSILECLSGAEVVFVTEDSASMLADAVNCRLPTVSIRPPQSTYNGLTTPFAEYLSGKNRIFRYTTESIDKKCSEESFLRSFVPVKKCWVQDFLETHKVLRR